MSIQRAIDKELRDFLGEDHHEWPILEAAMLRVAKAAAEQALRNTFPYLRAYYQDDFPGLGFRLLAQQFGTQPARTPEGTT